MTTHTTENPIQPETIASISPVRHWWRDVFILALGERDAATNNRAGMIYRPIAFESGKLITMTVAIDGTVAPEAAPIRIFDLGIITSSADVRKAGNRMFSRYDAAVVFARLAKATLPDDNLTDEQKAQAKALSLGETLVKPVIKAPEVTAPAKPVNKAPAKPRQPVRIKRSTVAA